MKRKRIVAKLLALSLLFSGLPMTSAYAAELPEPAEAVVQEVEGEETPAEDAAVEDTDEKETDVAENDASAEQEKEAQDENAVTDETQQGDSEEAETTDETEENSLNDGETGVKEFKVAENAKMAGSNGVLYDGVTYLSVKNVLAMDEEAQEVYRSLCDAIAASKEGGLEIQDVVFAVDANGDLYCSAYVPMRVLEEIEADMLPDVEGTLTPEAEESVAEEKKDDETSEDDKDAVEEEKKDDETSEDDKDAVEEEKKDDETSEDGKDAAEEKKDDETSEDDKDAAEEEKKDGEDAVEATQDIEAVEDEQTAEEESEELFAENLDLIPDMEEETFEEIESVRVENTIDLGYGSNGSDSFVGSSKQFNVVLPQDDFFVKQLTDSQKKYYEMAKAKFTKGSNKFTFTGSVSALNTIGNDVLHAISALILTYPDKTDWMAKPGGASVIVKYVIGSSVGTYTVTLDKSKFYSGSLDSKAKTQVQTVANLAQQYAAENYSGTPVYGVVKYFDQWVCENGYYEEIGTVQLTGFPDPADPKKTLTPEAYLKSLGLNSTQIKTILDAYYKCHSTYGILLEGYGVCESYAKTMSRLLDAVGIPNIYVVGTGKTEDGEGGHAWNYVQMPDSKWYLLDSTWNDTTRPEDTTSMGTYLLAAGDTDHIASGANFNGEKDFSFLDLAGSKYTGNSAAESVTLNKHELNLLPKGKDQLTYQINGKDSFGKAAGVWSSSDAKVAKVDQKGNVTAVAAGAAIITFATAGMIDNCTVYVDQIKAVKSVATNKTSESVSLGNTATTKGSKTVELTVDMGNSLHTAEWMIGNDSKTTAPEITYSKQGVVKATATVAGNTITVDINALQDGSTKVTVKFGGKSVAINVTAGQIITEEMFEVSWPAGETADSTADARKYAYTGKAIKPTVKKKDGATATFKATYVNNVNAGTAKLVLTGTGMYGGVLEYAFTIKPLDITGADFSKELKSKVYNGGDNPPATAVKLDKKTLKVNKDYEILYNGEKNTGALAAGTYTVSIRGIGNYTGTVTTTQSYEVTKNTIAKVSVTGSSSAKYTGLPLNPYTVKIGKNVLPVTDYEIQWYQGQGKTMSATPMKAKPIAKGKYTAVVTVKGNNLTTTDKKTKIEKKFTVK